VRGLDDSGGRGLDDRMRHGVRFAGGALGGAEGGQSLSRLAIAIAVIGAVAIACWSSAPLIILFGHIILVRLLYCILV
jgi:hypothetical protein